MDLIHDRILQAAVRFGPKGTIATGNPRGINRWFREINVD
jgi:hypothetical protein